MNDDNVSTIAENPTDIEVSPEFRKKKRSVAGRPPKYLRPINSRLKGFEVMLAELDAQVRLMRGGKAKGEGLVPPGVFFMHILSAGVAGGMLNLFDPTIGQMIAANAGTMWEAYKSATKAAMKHLDMTDDEDDTVKSDQMGE